MLEILTGYGFSITLSLDGPREIHDRKRVNEAGKGTHDAIVKNIRELMARGVPVEFERTYSNEHLRQGMDLVGLMDYFYDEFGCRTLHAPIVSAAPDSPEFIPLATCRTLQSDARLQARARRHVLAIAGRSPPGLGLALRGGVETRGRPR